MNGKSIDLGGLNLKGSHRIEVIHRLREMRKKERKNGGKMVKSMLKSLVNGAQWNSRRI